MPLVLVTGGARSGKSAFAQRRADAFPSPRLYIATGEPGDDEMRARIACHRAERGAGWQTAESPTDPAAALATPAQVVVLDCLTLWVSNLMLAGHDDAAVHAAAVSLADACAAAAVPVYAVTNEVGLGIVPEHAVARRFRDLAGRVNQLFGARAVEVWLLVCGQPLRIK
jgi:adenosylcobinamide kinase/adenosylcobinamide-phosphate guanylyltransferase